jgi:hypothetical protein
MNVVLAYRNAINIPAAVLKAAAVYPDTVYVPFICGILAGTLELFPLFLCFSHITRLG